MTTPANDGLPPGWAPTDAAGRPAADLVTPPLAVEPGPTDLDQYVEALARDHARQAAVLLEGSDPLLHPIRSRVRPTVEPVLADFAARLATAENAALNPGPTIEEFDELTRGRLRGADNAHHPLHAEYQAVQARIKARGRLSADGIALEREVLAAARTAAITAAVQPLAAELDAAEAKVTAQLDAAAARPDPDAVNAAVGLIAQLDRLTPRHGVPVVARFLRDAAASKARGAVVAALPMLKSLYEGTTPWGGAPALRDLIVKAEAITQTWQHVVGAARLDRIRQTRQELAAYAQRVLAGDAGPTVAGSTADPKLAAAVGVGELFPAEAPPTASADDVGAVLPRGRPVRRITLTPAQRAAAARDAKKLWQRDDDD